MRVAEKKYTENKHKKGEQGQNETDFGLSWLEQYKFKTGNRKLLRCFLYNLHQQLMFGCIISN